MANGYNMFNPYGAMMPFGMMPYGSQFGGMPMQNKTLNLSSLMPMMTDEQKLQLGSYKKAGGLFDVQVPAPQQQSPVMGLMSNPFFQIGLQLMDPSKNTAQKLQGGVQGLMQADALKRKMAMDNLTYQTTLQNLMNQQEKLQIDRNKERRAQEEFNRPKYSAPIQLQTDGGQLIFQRLNEKTNQYEFRTADGTLIENEQLKDINLTPYQNDPANIREFSVAKTLGLIPQDQTYDTFLSNKGKTIQTSFSPTESITAGLKEQKDFVKSDAYKNFNTKLIKFRELKEYAKNPTPFTDMSMIFALHKMLDPSSVVRGEEFALAESARPLADTISIALENIRSGKRLSDPQRKQILDVAKQSLLSEQIAYQTQFDQTVRGLRYLGMPPEAIADFEKTNLTSQLEQAINPDLIDAQKNITRRDIGNAIKEKGFFTGDGVGVARLYDIQNKLLKDEEELKGK